MLRRRDAVLAHRHAAGQRDLRAHLGGGQHAAMAGLGALAELELDHLDLVGGRYFGKFLRAESAVGIAGAEIARADLPDDVAAVLAVIGAEAAFTGVVRKAAAPGAAVQGADGVGAERPEAHGRDVEHRGRIGLGAIRTADRDPEGILGERPRRDRMGHPFVADAVDVVGRAERTHVEGLLGALVDHGAPIAREGHAVLVALEEVLPHLRADLLEDEAQMRGDWIVAQDRMAGLVEVVDADGRQEGSNDEADGKDGVRVCDPGDTEHRNREDAQGESDEAWRERQQQGWHPVLLGPPP